MVNGSDRRLLSGDLSIFPATQVLQWMTHYPGEGVLTVMRPSGSWEARIHVRAGEAISLQTRGSAPEDTPSLVPRDQALGGVLLKQGSVSLTQLRGGLALQQNLRGAGKGRLLGELLRGTGALDAPALDRALHALALGHLAALFIPSPGRFELRGGGLKPPTLPLNERIDRILLHAACLADDLDPDPRS